MKKDDNKSINIQKLISSIMTKKNIKLEYEMRDDTFDEMISLAGTVRHLLSESIDKEIAKNEDYLKELLAKKSDIDQIIKAEEKEIENYKKIRKLIMM